METVIIDRSCFLGLALAAIEAYNRETNGFLVGNRGFRTMRRRRREVTVLRAAYPLQTEDRKRNWVGHGNLQAFERAQRAIENLDVGYEILGGFHSHTGEDGDARLSRTDLEYVADELRRRERAQIGDGPRWLEIVVALKRRQWAQAHLVGWTTRHYRRKIGCTIALDANQGYDLVLGGYWVEGEPDGAPGTWDYVDAEETKLLLPWSE